MKYDWTKLLPLIGIAVGLWIIQGQDDQARKRLDRLEAGRYPPCRITKWFPDITSECKQ